MTVARGRKPGLDMARHAAIGAELAWMRDRLTTIAVEVANAYPQSARGAQLARKVTDPLDKLRHALERAMLAQHGHDAAVVGDIEGHYYPTREARRAYARTPRQEAMP